MDRGQRQRLIGAEPLREIAAQVLAAAGAEADEAVLVARHLVEANLRGHDSHGVGMIPRYVEDVAAGRFAPGRGLRLLEDGGAFMRFTGDMGFGQRIGTELTAALIERVAAAGAVIATLRDSYHLGRIGAYAEQALAAGYVSIHFVNVTGHAPAVAPFRGAEARFLTNPVCIGFPGAGAEPPFVADLATSAIALQKVRVAAAEGRRLDPGVAIDGDGRPTTDPAALSTDGGAPTGALLPFGLHKGYCLLLGAELLAGVLGGGGTGGPEGQRRDSIVNSMLSIVLDPARFAPEDWIAGEVESLLGYVRSCRPAAPAEPVLVPGDPERVSTARRQAEGIPVDAATWAAILAAGARAGLDAAALDAAAS